MYGRSLLAFWRDCLHFQSQKGSEETTEDSEPSVHNVVWAYTGVDALSKPTAASVTPKRSEALTKATFNLLCLLRDVTYSSNLKMRGSIFLRDIVGMFLPPHAMSSLFFQASYVYTIEFAMENLYRGNVDT
jgi:hypothetical protein